MHPTGSQPVSPFPQRLGRTFGRTRADIEDGNRAGVTVQGWSEVRELRKRNRLLEQENEILRRPAVYLGGDVNPSLRNLRGGSLVLGQSFSSIDVRAM